MDQLTQKEIYEQYRNILMDWIPSGASIAIAVEDRFVYFASGHQNISLEVGSLVPEDSMAYRVLEKRKKVDAMMDSSLFDIPYYASGYPLIIDGKKAAIIVVLPPLFHQDKKEELQFLTGKFQDDWVPVMIDEISYIESLQKKTWFYRNAEQFKTNITLKELQTKLPSNFIRIHRSYIVNIRFISRISKDITSNYIVRLQNGVDLPVSQSYVSSVREIMQI
ncbi:MAG: LytTR family DNA-binding domain-containing protein [Lysinibacillus sp.]